MSLAAQVMETRHDQPRSAKSQPAHGSLSSARARDLQRLAGNAAVTQLIALQRCGPTGCDCPENIQRDELVMLQRLAGNRAVSELLLQREAVPAAGASGASISTGPTAAAAAATGAACGVPSGCPPAFCTPFASKAIAFAVRQAGENTLLAGIAVKVSPRVVPLWFLYLHGGTPPLDLSGSFGPDFTTSRTTATVTDFLKDELTADLASNPPTFPPGSTAVTIDLPSRLGAAMTTDIGDPGGRMPMDFNVIGEIPGNIAGGIGKDQLSCPVGAQPSPFNDDRSATGTARVVKNPDGTLTVTPSITYRVQDTIDLCPGNCGADIEQIATVTLSRLEASGVSGDVPFTVTFPAPPRTFDVTPVLPPPPPPTPTTTIAGKTTASMLHIRKGPSTSSAIVGNYPRGSGITILCQTEGTEVDGNSTWDQTDKGFVSDRYVKRLDSDDPPNCSP